MSIFAETTYQKLEFLFLLLAILSPLILIFAEPFTFFVNDRVYEIYSSVRFYLWVGSFFLFSLFSFFNSFLTFKKSPPGKFKQATSSKLLLTLLLLLLFGLAFKGKNSQSDWTIALSILIYFSLFFYLILAYLSSFLLWLKRKPHQTLTVYSAVIVFSWLIFTVNVALLYEKVRDLRWEDSKTESKIDEIEEISNTLWEERAFAKEMSENLSYYLPEGYNQKPSFLDLTPIDLEFHKARVKFLYAGKTYTVDFSYSGTRDGWNINRLSKVTLEP
ncbi:hypothetical protein HY339_03255 [Candidatus Gottesmanbacteria bacterium]|nr:hypothetical protein [Candidatus Gottesmanbacteria bacterium]